MPKSETPNFDDLVEDLTGSFTCLSGHVTRDCKRPLFNGHFMLDGGEYIIAILPTENEPSEDA